MFQTTNQILYPSILQFTFHKHVASMTLMVLWLEMRGCLLAIKHGNANLP